MTDSLIAPSVAGKDFDAAKAEVRLAVADFLAALFDRQSNTEVARAARYAAGGPAHRWRAIAAVAAGKIFRDDALNVVISAACGVELAHAASLVLDDLPSMDDARFRRGRPCTHQAFPSWAVDMTPVFLVTLAYQISLDNPAVAADRRIKAALALSDAGIAMIRGQSHDMLQDMPGTDDGAWLIECYRLKSSALYGAAAMMGGILCGADDTEAASLYAAGLDLGLSYQFLDDVADVEAGLAEVGKESGMDAGKRTAVDLFGVDGARARSKGFQTQALTHLRHFGPEADWLRSLIMEASWKAS